MLEFYNQRRKQLLGVLPNDAHNYLARLSEKFEVSIITQNIDDLHERAGSKNVLHLHGELRKSRSGRYDHLIYDIDGWELKMGEHCERGEQLRPHVVWFGEAVPMMEPAIELIQSADMVWVIGTSLVVYPAAGLLHEVKQGVPVIVIDPGNPEFYPSQNIHHIKEKAAGYVKNLVLKMLDS